MSNIISNKDQVVKSTFLMKLNSKLKYELPANADNRLFIGPIGNIKKNDVPFKPSNKLSYFEQIFVPEVKSNTLNIYKSELQPNTFLIIAKEYNITRDLETSEPCIRTIMHAREDDSGLQDISEIEFQFAISPKLSDYDEAKIKQVLKTNELIDKEVNNIIDEITFLYPNDLNIDFSITGNQFLEKASIVKDGNSFIFNLKTQNLAEASIFINALNNSISQYANIFFKYKEINDVSSIVLDLEKTIGSSISIKLNHKTKTVIVENCSLSPCKLKNAITIDEKDKIYSNMEYFKSLDLLRPNMLLEFAQKKINQEKSSNKIEQIFIDHESIENFETEFDQIIDSSSSYNRYLTINIDPQIDKINAILIEIEPNGAGNIFKKLIPKEKFNRPILINILLKNSNHKNSEVTCKSSYYDSNDNIINIIYKVIDYLNTPVIKIQKG